MYVGERTHDKLECDIASRRGTGHRGQSVEEAGIPGNDGEKHEEGQQTGGEEDGEGTQYMQESKQPSERRGVLYTGTAVLQAFIHTGST